MAKNQTEPEAPVDEYVPDAGSESAEAVIDVPVDDAVELQSVSPGEYRLRIVDASMAKSLKTGGMYLNARLEICEQPYTKDITHILMFPASDDDAKKANNRKLALRNFYQAFGIDFSRPVAIGVLKGREAWAVLKEEEDPEYGMNNRVKKWVVGA